MCFLKLYKATLNKIVILFIKFKYVKGNFSAYKYC